MTEASAQQGAMPAIVVVARHGERMDYIMRDAGENWVAGAERPWDPPLSAHGKTQGTKLGTHLEAELERLQLPPLSAVYSSPLLRCRQTSVSAMQGFKSASSAKGSSRTAAAATAATPMPLLSSVRVELGLAESINESWYRSWALPGSNGTWGFRPTTTDGLLDDTIDPATLHPASKQPVLGVLDWKSTLSDSDCKKEDGPFDLEHEYVTSLESSYSFHPKALESKQEQRRRMMETVSQLSMPGRTVLLVSHGGPVTHLYEEMTGNGWKAHGESSYCCYSIYRQCGTTGGTGNKEWEALSVNESKYLHEKVTTERHVS